MEEQRAQALAETRKRIVNAAKSVFTIRLEMTNGIDIHLTIEHKRTEDLNFDAVRSAVTDFVKAHESEAKTFDVLSDDIYEVIGSQYPERDIEVQIVNNYTNSAFTKIYNTHQPYQSLAI